MGFWFGGGVSDSLYYQDSSKHAADYWSWFFFDVGFFILLKMILLNIFSGIIIDTFGDLRDKMNA